MTSNSIEYITKQHFHSLLSVILTLVTIAIAAVSVAITVLAGISSANAGIAVFAGFSSLSALFAVIRMFSVKNGCTLMRISIGISALLCFLAGMGMFTLGYLLIKNNDIQNHINSYLSLAGFTIVTRPRITAILMISASVLLYMASGCSFFGHRYLGAVRSCAGGTIRRSGLRVFPAVSLILFILSVLAAFTLLMLSGDAATKYKLLSDITSNQVNILSAALVFLLYLHLLLSGICARSFASKTFAFKVFEKQIMKVETNADGTVYVPISKDEEPDAGTPQETVKAEPVSDRHQNSKPFIREISGTTVHSESENGRLCDESEII